MDKIQSDDQKGWDGIWTSSKGPMALSSWRQGFCEHAWKRRGWHLIIQIKVARNMIGIQFLEDNWQRTKSGLLNMDAS